MAKLTLKLARPVALSCLLMGATYSAFSQSLPENPRDFSGVWMNDNSLDERLKREGLHRLDPNEEESSSSGSQPADNLTNEYRQVYEKEQEALSRLAVGTQTCGWPGMPTIMTYPYPFEILDSPDRITIIYEAESQVRRIYMDRDEHLPYEELDPTYNGDSIGHWEDNTLVISTRGFNTLTKVQRLPHSEEMHIVERWRYVDEDTVHVDLTITDPLAFKEPVTQEIVYSKRPDWRIREYHCLENNRDAPDEHGKRSGGVVN